MKKLLLILFIISSFNSKGAIYQISVWNGYYQFLPTNNITVQLGDTIQWIPLDPPTMYHTITSDNIPVGAAPFNKSWQMPADTFFQYIPQVAGLYQYVCTPHISFGMIGEFTVVNGTIPQQTYVPDDNFEAYLEANGMGDGIQLNDSVNFWAIEMLINLDVSNQNIFDLTGIEDFTALTFLDCKDNQINSLDLSNNLYLEFVACYNNQLNSLDVSGLTALWNLDCGNNNLTSLDLSNNTALQEFSIYNNQLISLDVSNNIMLGILAASGNQLTSIDVSNNIYLSELSLYGNSLFSLDVVYNTNLVDLKCDGNQITNIDVSNNTALTHLYCAANQLISLNVSQNLSLTHLSCGTNPLTTLDLSNNTALTNLDCFNGQLTTLDLSNNPALIYLICKNGQLTSLDLRNGNNQLISTMHCKNNLNLYCINVDDMSWSTVNWTLSNNSIDSQQYFSNNCNGTGTEELTTSKELLKVTDLLVRETKGTKNKILFYIYDDGTVERKIIIE